MVILPNRFRLRPKAVSSGRTWPGNLRLLFCKWITVITFNATSANRDLMQKFLSINRLTSKL